MCNSSLSQTRNGQYSGARLEPDSFWQLFNSERAHEGYCETGGQSYNKLGESWIKRQYSAHHRPLHGRTGGWIYWKISWLYSAKSHRYYAGLFVYIHSLLHQNFSIFQPYLDIVRFFYSGLNWILFEKLFFISFFWSFTSCE